MGISRRWGGGSRAAGSFLAISLSLEVESLRRHVEGTSRLSPPGPAPGHTRAGGQKEEVLALRAWVTWREQEGKGRRQTSVPATGDIKT